MTRALPPDFPAPSLPIMRALSAIAVADEGNQARVVQALDAFFTQHWEHAVATHRPEVLKETLAGLFGADEAEKSGLSRSSSTCIPPSPQVPPTSNADANSPSQSSPPRRQQANNPSSPTPTRPFPQAPSASRGWYAPTRRVRPRASLVSTTSGKSPSSSG